MTTELTGAALLSQRHGAPIWLIERSAAARAKASRTTSEAVLSDWAQTKASETVASQPVPATEGPGDAEEPGDDAGGLPPSDPSAGGVAEGGGEGQVLSDGPVLAGPALLTAVAEARGMPESLIQRSAQARAGAAGVSLDDVLHEWAEEEGLEAPTPPMPAPGPRASSSSPLPTPAPKAKPSTPVAAGLTGASLLTAVAEARGMPESLVERSAKARAKKTDATVEDVLTEWAQEAGITAASPETPTEPAPSSPSSGDTAEGPGGGGQALTGASLLTAVAEARGMPESLVERSAKARAKKTDATVEDVLTEWAQEAGITAASPETPAVVPTTDTVAVPETQDEARAPDANALGPDAAPDSAAGQTRSWQRSVAIGAISALVPLAILAVLAVFVDVPTTLSEAPWYLVGHEPFLGYLEPFIALVIIPGVVLSSIVILAVVAWSPAVHPSTRRLALMVLVFLILIVGALSIIGALQA